MHVAVAQVEHALHLLAEALPACMVSNWHPRRDLHIVASRGDAPKSESWAEAVDKLPDWCAINYGARKAYHPSSESSDSDPWGIGPDISDTDSDGWEIGGYFEEGEWV